MMRDFKGPQNKKVLVEKENLWEKEGRIKEAEREKKVKNYQVWSKRFKYINIKALWNLKWQ